MRTGFPLVFATVVFAASATVSLQAEHSVGSRRSVAHRKAVVNFSEIAQAQSLSPAAGTPIRRVRPRRLHRADGFAPELQLQPAEATEVSDTLALEAALIMPSPPLTAHFLALLDNETVIPPDTMGAVGPNHVMTTLNSQVRIQDRSGGVISTVSLNSFWAGLGNQDAFDPHVTYDAFNNRWILTAVANDGSPASAVLVGVSATSDPTGNWFLFSADADGANQLTADYDNLGYNKKWIAVSANMFRISNDKFSGVRFFIFDKADLYTNGSGAFTMIESHSDSAVSVAPAITQDDSLDTLYCVEDWDGSAGQLRVSTITGPVGNEVLTIGTAFPATTNRWESFNFPDNLAPQFGLNQGIDVGDARVLTCLYRNGALWVTQNALLPAGKPKRCSAQWWQFQPNGAVQQFGRVDDSSGIKFYAFPSLAVNASNDVLIGYSRFSAFQYASGNYSFRFATDPLNTLRADTVLKAGEGTYLNTGNSKLNRWGDYSSTVVDPVDDTTLWTIQEYAASDNRWGTWWGRVEPDLSALRIALARPADGITYPSNPTVTLTATRLDTNVTFTLVEFYADDSKIGQATAEPFTTTWVNATDGPHALVAIATDSLGGLAMSSVVTIFVGDRGSPVGTWEAKISGPAKGNAVVIFGDDFSISGYGMTLGTFGLFTISGAWSFNPRQQIAGSYIEWLDGSDIFSGSFVGKAAGGRKVSVQVTSESVPKALRLKGKPLATVPDLRGNWLATVKTADAPTMETYELTPSATLTNVLDLTGQTSSGTLTGAVLVNSRGQLNVSTEGAAERSLAGKAKAATSLSLKGQDEAGQRVTVKATR